MKKKRLPVCIVVVLFSFVLLLSQCNNHDANVTVVNKQGKAFAGSESCRSCHKAIYDSFIHTAHYADSRMASKENVKGNFADSANRFLYNYNMNRIVVMEERNEGLYQVAYINRKPTEAHRFDIVIGSGRKGQSYLTWEGQSLFQLPISYFAPENAWVNSPGYPTSDIKFDRVVHGRCLECHSTYAKELSPDSLDPKHLPEFDKTQILYGIGCERCHGAAADHVAFHTQHPDAKQGAFIVNPAKLSRQQRLDACALCHSGLGERLKPAFSFEVSDTLAHYYAHDSTTATNAALDVHGNQYGLLAASKCFKISGTMDCISCHNTHLKQNNAAVFSQKCMTCHTEATHNFCTMKGITSAVLKANCIDCHMPVQDSKTLTIGDPKLEKATAAKVRSHLIAIYKDATQNYVSTLKP